MTENRNMIRTLILATVAGMIALAPARAQDTRDIISILTRMEANIKSMVEAEKQERLAAQRALADKIASLEQDRKTPGTAVAERAGSRVADVTAQLRRLREGNARFVTGKTAPRDFPARRNKLVAGQKPYAIIVGCSDSRVPPELIFDESLGDLFPIRVAGNVLDSVGLGSVEYAAEHLGTRLLVIMGHERCGAVTAALAGGDVSPNVASIVRRIAPAVASVTSRHPADSLAVHETVEENVRRQVHLVTTQSGVLRERLEAGDLAVVGAVYDLASGEVTFLESPSGATLSNNQHP